MAFDFGQLLNTLGHNFMQNARDQQMGGMNPMGAGMDQGQPTLSNKMMGAAQILTGQGAPPQGQQSQQQQGGMGGVNPMLLQALLRLGGQSPAAPVNTPPPANPLTGAAQGVQASLGQQTGLPLADPRMTPMPSFASMFSRFGGGY